MHRLLVKYFRIEYIFILILVVCASYLRFTHLGYSDYIGDEHKALLEVPEGMSLSEFFNTRRKGPMQFLVSHISFLFTQDYRNEFGTRLPFAITSVLAVIAHYMFVKKFSSNKIIAFLSSFLFLVNGFIVGFGRIAQYQNLNLLFNFLSLFFYLDLISDKTDKKKLISSLLGTLFFSLSLLSHWDVIFIIPVIGYIFGKYLLNKDISKKEKLRLIIFNIILGCILLLPFLIPYTMTQLAHSDNQEYFARRVSTGVSNNNLYLQYIQLYNPFYTLYFISALAIIGLIGIKKNWVILLWFIYVYSLFELLVRKPGTHIYNFVIPAMILAGYGMYYIIKYTPKYLKFIPILGIFLSFSFLYYQSHYIYVDHRQEYPWDSKTYFEGFKKENRDKDWVKKIPVLKTRTYSIKDKLPLFGFTHSRDWNMINEYVNEHNRLNGTDYGFMSNEDKTVNQWYMDAGYDSTGEFYAIGIKDPMNYVKDWQLTNIGNKELLEKFSREGSTDGDSYVRIYLVQDTD